jgi:hypothetical protein
MALDLAICERCWDTHVHGRWCGGVQGTNGVVACPSVLVGVIYTKATPLHAPPPTWCPYKLEHAVSAGRPVLWRRLIDTVRRLVD